MQKIDLTHIRDLELRRRVGEVLRIMHRRSRYRDYNHCRAWNRWDHRRYEGRTLSFTYWLDEEIPQRRRQQQERRNRESGLLCAVTAGDRWYEYRRWLLENAGVDIARRKGTWHKKDLRDAKKGRGCIYDAAPAHTPTPADAGPVDGKRRTRAKITYTCGDFPYYVVGSAGECRDEVDREAYLIAINDQESTQLGKVCVELLEG